MENFIAQMLNRFESGSISRRQLINTLAAAVGTFGATGTLVAQDAPPQRGTQPKTKAQLDKVAELQAAQKEAPFKAMQISHLRYTCADYKLSRDYYQEVMGMHLVPGSDNGSQCKLAFYPKGETPLGQPKGTPSPYVLMRNGYQPPSAPPDPTKPRVNSGHIAYTVQFDKALSNGKVTWDKGTTGDANGALEVMRGILTKRGLANVRQDQDTSFHVTDPNGYDLQISGVGMNGYTG